MTGATYSHDHDGARFQLPIGRDDEHRRQLIELGLRVTFALAQENESSARVRETILVQSFRSWFVMAELCYWCHDPLPPLPEDASYVDEINHYIHDECRDERDQRNRRLDDLRAGIVEGSIDSIPEPVRQAVLDRIKKNGFSRRCPCLYDPEHGFQGYQSHSYSDGEAEVDDYDERNSVKSCELCGGSGVYDPLPKLLELTDDKAAEAWIVEELPRSSGPCDHWRGFPEEGWYYDALGYNRVGKGPVRGVTVYTPERMLGGVISWLEIADLFRPRLF